MTFPPQEASIGRLKRRAQFVAMRKARRLNAKAFTLQAAKRDEPGVAVAPPRFGITVTKANGNAAMRNRIRRRLREAVKQCWRQAALPGHDYVVIARPAALAQPFGAMVSDLAETLDQAGRKRANPARGVAAVRSREAR